ncbi:pilus assembly protein TadG-related protein [Oceanobacillus rekensis]|uniref:pilus assembly protein TadG-related protein n=1 Tax=Oceanobacillus rekensis TaxID=937927 RepID=UPI000B44684C|nr:pilus assembly protein TadG-related protein [Oceanobacillus rekensis]
MIKKLRARFNNEQGSIMLFVLGMLGIMGVLFVFVLNMGMALAVKEQSATTAQQASMAASSVVYEEVREIVFGFDYEEALPEEEPSEESSDDPGEAEDEEELPYENLEDKLEEAVDELLGRSQYSDWSDNERELQALDRYLTDVLFPIPIIGDALKLKLRNAPIEDKAIDMARSTILQNGGVLDEAELWIDSNRIYVRAANEMEGVSYDGFMEGIEENIFQESAGPEIDFLTEIWNESTTISLD